MHINTRSIFKKLNLIERLYANTDVLGCSETWLDNRIPDNLIRIQDMKIFRTDRTKTLSDYNVHITGGGVCIYISKKWSDFTNKCADFSFVNTDIEIITVTMIKPVLKNY